MICNIENQNADDFPVIVLRKIYQVIFWESDFRTLYIYTAIVCGANDIDKDGNLLEKRLLLKDNFNIKISFKNDDIQEIKHESRNDLIQQEFDVFKTIWGTESRLIRNNNEFNDIYTQEYYQNKTPKHHTQLTIGPNSYFVYISDSKKQDLERTICKIVTHTIDDESYRINGISGLTNEDSKVELLNYTKTTIRLKKKLENQMRYKLQLSNRDNQRFHCPDNSMYFILPEGFNCKADSDLTIEHEKAQALNLQNVLNRPSKDKSHYFKEWQQMRILNRDYSRILEQYGKKFDPKVKGLDLCFYIENSTNEILKEFIYALIVSLFFSYCLDQSRLNNLKSLFFGYNIIIPDLNFVLVFSPLILSSIFKINLGNKPEQKISYWFRVTGIVCSIVWFLYLYLFANSKIYAHNDSTTQVNFDNNIIIYSYCLNGLSILFNYLGLLFFWFSHKNEISIRFSENLKRLFSHGH